MNSEAAANDTCSLFNRLSDDIVLEILRKVIDFKTLSLCKLVSRRFNRIVNEVDAVSFNAPSNWNTCDVIYYEKLSAFTTSEPLCRGYAPPVGSPFSCSFLFAIKSMTKFTRLKSLCIELPLVSSLERIYGDCLFKWKANIGNNGFDSFALVSPNSIYDDSNQLVYGNDESITHPHPDICGITYKCLSNDVMTRNRILLSLIIDFPFLEKVSITDFGKRGKISLSGTKLAEVKKWLNSPSISFERMMYFELVSCRSGECRIPLLELPVSGFVMKGVTLVLMERGDLRDKDNYDCYINSVDDLEDKDESAYSEAMVEIFKKHRGLINMSNFV